MSSILRSFTRFAFVAFLGYGATAVASDKADTEQVAAAPVTVAAAVQPVQTLAKDGQGSYRFHMSQDGRNVSADEFDAWMKTHGIRVARGAAPAAVPAAAAVAVEAAETVQANNP